MRYLYCGPSIHTGCGKRLCKDHLTIQRTRHGDIRFYHCKEKSNKCENKYTCGAITNMILIIGMLFIVIIIIAFTGHQNLKSRKSMINPASNCENKGYTLSATQTIMCTND